MGAFDGIHIQAILGGPDAEIFRNYKGNKTWNALAVCSFGMMFTYINAGWERCPW